MFVHILRRLYDVSTNLMLALIVKQCSNMDVGVNYKTNKKLYKHEPMTHGKANITIYKRWGVWSVDPNRRY